MNYEKKMRLKQISNNEECRTLISQTLISKTMRSKNKVDF